MCLANLLRSAKSETMDLYPRPSSSDFHSSASTLISPAGISSETIVENDLAVEPLAHPPVNAGNLRTEVDTRLKGLSSASKVSSAAVMTMRPCLIEGFVVPLHEVATVDRLHMLLALEEVARVSRGSNVLRFHLGKAPGFRHFRLRTRTSP